MPELGGSHLAFLWHFQLGMLLRPAGRDLPGFGLALRLPEFACEISDSVEPMFYLGGFSNVCCFGSGLLVGPVLRLRRSVFFSCVASRCCFWPSRAVVKLCLVPACCCGSSQWILRSSLDLVASSLHVLMIAFLNMCWSRAPSVPVAKLKMITVHSSPVLFSGASFMLVYLP